MNRTLVLAGFIALSCIADGALTHNYPARPIRLIAAQSAGSLLDTVTRIVTPKMPEMLGRQLVIDWRPAPGQHPTGIRWWFPDRAQ